MVADTDTPNQHSLDNTAEEFLLSLVKDYQKIQYDYHIPDLIAYISENYYDKQLLSDYAAKKNISENYLSHIVKKESGISFRKLLAQIRCRKALQLLTLPNYRLTDLSFDIGYSSLVFFNNNFKEIYGLLPSDYNIKTTSSESGLSETNDDPAYLTIKLDEFAYRQNISVSAKSDINYSRHYINIDDVISKLPDYMSDIGRIKNINADMNESIHSAFINMRQGFPMNTIVVEVEDAFSHSDTSAYITISKNIYYLQNLGFIVALEMKDLSQLTLQSVINFLGFYGRVYRQNVESIKFMISGDYTSKNVQLFKEQLSHELMSNYNLLSEIKINNPTVPLVNFIPELYDSHVLTPFAMDELFHPERWDKEMDFSLIDNVSKSGMMLRGGNGLLTWNGKQKPWWYAYNFVAKLSGNLISRGEDHLVSSDENKVTIITYNLCNQKLSFLSKISTSEKLRLISEQKGHSREHYFNIYNLHGKYRVTRHEINKSTCLFSKWFDMGCPDYLSDDDNITLKNAGSYSEGKYIFDISEKIKISLNSKKGQKEN